MPALRTAALLALVVGLAARSVEVIYEAQAARRHQLPAAAAVPAMKCTSGDCSSGFGRTEHTNGDVYEGNWMEDKKHGQGKTIFSDGAVYDGEWAADRFHGNGKYTWADGAHYSGEWMENQKHGRGMLVDANNGASYDGDFVRSKKHG